MGIKIVHFQGFVCTTTLKFRSLESTDVDKKKNIFSSAHIRAIALEISRKRKTAGLACNDTQFRTQSRSGVASKINFLLYQTLTTDLKVWCQDIRINEVHAGTDERKYHGHRTSRVRLVVQAPLRPPACRIGEDRVT